VNAWTALLVAAALILLGCVVSVRIVRPHQKGVIEQLGKYKETVGPGVRLVVPVIQRLRPVDMREQVVYVPLQEAITSDNVVVAVDAVIYYEPTEPARLVYNVVDFTTALTELAQTNLRSVVGGLQLDRALTSRELINLEMRETLDDATDKWGVRVGRVETRRLDPLAYFTHATNEQLQDERGWTSSPLGASRSVDDEGALPRDRTSGRGSWWGHLGHAAISLRADMEMADQQGRLATNSLGRIHELLRRALWLAGHRPRRMERARQWWSQADAISALSAIHAADEELAAARPRTDLLARLPVLRADLAGLLGQDDPRRRDVLRLLDRLVDSADEELRQTPKKERERQQTPPPESPDTGPGSGHARAA
jgi:hypothetical protein